MSWIIAVAVHSRLEEVRRGGNLRRQYRYPVDLNVVRVHVATVVVISGQDIGSLLVE